ncbi:MAG: transcriptional repressor [Bacteroidales bacterium]
MNTSEVREILVKNRLKVTPQRITVYEAVVKLCNHPTAEEVINFIKENHPNIAVGTVYKVLETFVDIGLIKKVKTDRDIMRYDAVTNNHHHLYISDSDKIEDYYDNDLNEFLFDYFKKKSIPNFEIEELKLQIIGKFKKKRSSV